LKWHEESRRSACGWPLSPRLPLVGSLNVSAALQLRIRRSNSAITGAPPDELELETSDELRVLGRDADVAIRYVATNARRRGRGGRRLFSIDGIPVIAGVTRRPIEWRQDAAVLGHRLLHDDDGRAWRSWFAAAGLGGFAGATHQYFSDYSLAVAAAQQGQGIVLGAPAFIERELRSGRLVQLGRTRVAFGTYWLLEARDRSTTAIRAVFSRWLDSEISRVSRL